MKDYLASFKPLKEEKGPIEDETPKEAKFKKGDKIKIVDEDSPFDLRAGTFVKYFNNGKNCEVRLYNDPKMKGLPTNVRIQSKSVAKFFMH